MLHFYMIAPLSFLLPLFFSLFLSNFTDVENERERETFKRDYFKIDLFSYNVLLELTNNP